MENRELRNELAYANEVGEKLERKKRAAEERRQVLLRERAWLADQHHKAIGRSTGVIDLTTEGGTSKFAQTHTSAEMDLQSRLQVINDILHSEFGRTIDKPPVSTSTTNDAIREPHPQFCFQDTDDFKRSCEKDVLHEDTTEQAILSPYNCMRSLDCHPHSDQEFASEYGNKKDLGQRSVQEKLMHESIWESMSSVSSIAKELDSHHTFKFEPFDLEETW